MTPSIITRGILDGSPASKGYIRKLTDQLPDEYYGILKRWTGTAWVISALKTYTNNTWQSKPIKMWNGTEWANIQISS